MVLQVFSHFDIFIQFIYGGFDVTNIKSVCVVKYTSDFVLFCFNLEKHPVY